MSFDSQLFDEIYQPILERKIAHYGETPAAYHNAAQEAAQEYTNRSMKDLLLKVKDRHSNIIPVWSMDPSVKEAQRSALSWVMVRINDFLKP